MYLPLAMLSLQHPIFEYKADLLASASLSARGNKTGKSLQKLNVLTQNHRFPARFVPVRFQPQKDLNYMLRANTQTNIPAI